MSDMSDMPDMPDMSDMPSLNEEHMKTAASSDAAVFVWS